MALIYTRRLFLLMMLNNVCTQEYYAKPIQKHFVDFLSNSRFRAKFGTPTQNNWILVENKLRRRLLINFLIEFSLNVSVAVTCYVILVILDPNSINEKLCIINVGVDLEVDKLFTSVQIYIMTTMYIYRSFHH